MLRRFQSRARSLSDYFSSSRGAGHTTLMLEGLKHFEGEVMLVAHSQTLAQSLAAEAMEANPKIKVIPRGLDVQTSLRGVRLPVAYDNSALLFLFAEALTEIAELTRKLKATIEELKATIEG